MPETSERRIEKLLKTAGAKRRAQAGRPQLHPATREILQTEVRRQYGSDPGRAGTRWNWGLRMLPKLAILAVLGASAWLLLKDSGPAPVTAPTRLAMEEPVPGVSPDAIPQAPAPVVFAAPAEQTSRLAREQAADEIAAKPASRRLDVTADVAESLPAKAPAVTEARSVVGPQYFKADRQGMYMGTAMVGGEAGQKDQGLDEDVALATLMESAPGARAAARGAAGTSAPGFQPVPVLQTFTVFNREDTVRVVDADGSVYEGKIQPVVAAPNSSAEGSERANISKMIPTLQTQPAAASSAVGGGVLLNYSFEASGTNRTLGQSVRFLGKLALTERQLEQGRNTFSNTVFTLSDGNLETVPASQSEAAKGRLQGRAVLSDGGDVAVDAVPTAP